MTTNTWKIEVGITRGTIGSRDFGVETTKFDSTDPLLSLDDCKETAKQLSQHYARMGYSTTAHAIAPGGTKHHNIHNG